ncbi:MAG TPA: DUF1385 domain-containing protein [Polyangiaceae bacterium]|nr:DUF1385 domain-containing protein [Polyangiaceae bacterium]
MSNQPAVIGPDGVARPYIGGQALLEGVMMRSPHAFAAVVRRKNGELVVREEPMNDPRRGVRAWPLVRGVTALVEALRLGSRSLRFAAEIYEQDLEEEEARAGTQSSPDAVRPPAAKPEQPSILSLLSLPIVALAMQDGSTPVSPKPKKEGSSALTFLSVAFALGLFIALPQASAAGISALFKLDLDVRSAAFQALTGAAKLIIIIGYMLAIRRIPEIRRVFQYHGAEHKSIYAYESGMPLSVENARSKTTLHPRCGTTFIVMVALVSVFVFSALGPLLPQFGLGRVADNVLFFLLKLPFLPVIAAATFELQRFLARFGTRGPLSVLLWPGFLVQKITTIEPDDKQLEVALGALAVTLAREQGRVAGAEPTSDRTYPSYATLLAGHS